MFIRKMYLDIFGLLQEKEYEKAWSQLAELEINIMNRKEFYEIPVSYRIDYILDKIHKFQKFYPYKFFISREAIIKEMKCSICQKKVNPVKPCGHQAGNVYCGELCSNIITDMDFIAFALVEDPVDKYAVIKPENKEHNYDVLDFLMNGLSDAFEDWHYVDKNVLKPEYEKAYLKRPCPCGSGIKYKRCCFGKEHTYMPHIDIVIDNPKKKLSRNRVTINSVWK